MINDKILKIKTNAIYKIIDLENNSGIITAKRLVNGGNSNELIHISSLSGFKMLKENEAEISYFNDEYNFLSDFYEYEFLFKNQKYKSVVHCLYSQKAITEIDKENIKNAKTPSIANFFGKKTKSTDNWDSIQFDVLYDIYKEKFSDPLLKEKLLNTKDKDLVYNNSLHDNLFGNCICNKCQDIKGKNNSGKILMKIRKEFK